MAWDRWTDQQLFEVARMYCEEGLTPLEVSARLGKSASNVRKMLKKAKERGIIKNLVVSPAPANDFRALAQRVRGWFELKDVCLVPGRENLMEDPGPHEKEILVFSIAQAAARYLEDHLEDGDILAVPWGRMLSYISRQLRPQRSLPNLVVVPMVGVMGVEEDPVGWSFEANTIAAQIAASFGGRAWQLPAPAVADHSCYRELQRHPLVSKVLAKLVEATVAVVSIAPVDPENSTVVRMGLLSKERVERFIKNGAVGEIASHWWFDRQGRSLTDEESYPIGLGLEGLRAMVKKNCRVIAVVGASMQRIEPLWVALQRGLVNILITDSVTAQRLLEIRV